MSSTSAHDLAQTRTCKLPGCANELTSDDPTRGIWANVCRPCRRGETPPGLLYREKRNVGGGGNPVPAGDSLESKVRALVPLAKALERKAVDRKKATVAMTAAVNEFSAVLRDIRDVAQSLVGGDGS